MGSTAAKRLTALSDLRLKLLADGAVNRIRTAAADGDDEAYRPDQQDILVSATTGRIPFRQMHEQQGHQHLEMLVALLFVHLPKGYAAGGGGYEYVLLIGAVCFVIAIRGGGPYSVDRAIGKEL